MALSALRLRRAVSLSSSLIKYQRLSSAVPSISSSPSLSPVTVNSENHIRVVIQSHRIHLSFQSRQFRSSSVCLSSVRSSFRNNPDEEIGPDTILFEGCDYNHWLITMDFPKDPEPTREEKIEAYLQTLAKVVGSYEEAKKSMYAFSTTTYQGFQCLVTEEMSEKFKGLPGVVFVLPDSYIDPVNKEYGGDKYENGVITPRPPPAQYGRQGGRYGDRNRPYRQGNQAYGNQGPVHGDTRNFGQQQNPQMRPNYGPMSPGNRRDPLPMNKANFNQNEQGYNPQAGSVPSVPPEQRGYSGDNRNYAPPQGVNHGQGSGGNYGQGAGGNYGQGAGGNYGQQGAGGNYGQQGAGGNYGQQGAGGNYGQGAGGNYGQGAGRNYGQHAGGNYGQDAGRNYGQHAGGSYGQGTGGNYGQGAGGNFGQGARGNNGQGTGGNQGQVLGTAPRQEADLGYGQSNPGHGEEPRFSQMEQRNNTHGEQRNYAPTGQAGTDQGRY